jgi:hypothetical protein
MKTSMKIVGLGVLLAMPVAVQAQTTRSVSVGVSGGLSLPMGDLGDAVESGYNVTGHLYYVPTTMKLGFRGDVGYDKWEGKGASATVDAKLGILSFTGNGLYTFGESTSAMRPYLLFGGGIYRSKETSEVAGVEGSTTGSDGGIQGGLGLSFKLSGFNTFLEARYVNVFSEGNSTNYLPITFGVRF